MASVAAGGAVAAAPFWRAAGMTYITYSNICASLVRSCLKEPYKSEAAAREKVHFSVSKWVDGKPEKPNCGMKNADDIIFRSGAITQWEWELDGKPGKRSALMHRKHETS